MKRAVFLMAAVLGVSVFAQAQTTIYFRRDTIYAGPGGGPIAIVTPAPSDSTAPTAPSSLGTTSTTATSVALSWTGSTDSGGSGLAGYKIYRAKGSGANLPVGTVNSSTTAFTDQPLEPSTVYYYTVVAYDLAQNHSSASNSVNPTTSSAASDTTAPTVPTGLAVSLLTRNSVRVTWNPSTDVGGSGIQGYKVYRDSTLVSGSTPITTRYFDQSGLSYKTLYAFKVEAVDNVNNVSAQTSAVNITTDRQLLWSDYFNRAESPTLGSGWTTISGFSALQVQNARAVAASGATYLSGSGASSATIFKLSTDITYHLGRAGLVFYGQGPAAYIVVLDSDYLNLYYCTDVSSSCDHWDSVYLGQPQGPGNLAVEANASTDSIKVYWNSSLKLNFSATQVDDQYMYDTMAGGVGLYAYSAVHFDNFLLESN